jgi:hypothetical protein
MRALFGQARVVQAQHAVLLIAPALRDQQSHTLCIQGRGIPGTIHQKLLQLLQRRLRQHLGHALHVLAWQLRHQSQQVLHAVMHAPLAGKHGPKLFHKPLQRGTLYLSNHQLHR